MNGTSSFLAQIFGNNPAAAQTEEIAKSFYFSNLGIFKVVGLFLSVFFIAATVFFMVKTGWIALRIDRFEDVVLKRNIPKRRSIKAWRNIQKLFYAGDDNSLKLAIIEADNVLDETLKLAGFMGENIGERLKKVTPDQLPNIDLIWEAHKLRNRLVHETDFQLNRDLAERALAIYQQTFQDLGLIDVE